MQMDNALMALADQAATWILWALVALSVGGLSVVLERTACFWSTRDDVYRLSDELRPWIADGRWDQLARRLSESPSFEARVVAAAVGQEDPTSAEQLLQAATERVRIEMEHHLSFLGTLGSNAPFVGLLGTVIGIVGAFQRLDESQGALSDGLMAAVGEALLATAVGLCVALPAVAAFNFFRRLAQLRLSRAEVLSRTFLALLHARAAREGRRR
jgi:biopolymer transport protein ExbB